MKRERREMRKEKEKRKEKQIYFSSLTFFPSLPLSSSRSSFCERLNDALEEFNGYVGGERRGEKRFFVLFCFLLIYLQKKQNRILQNYCEERTGVHELKEKAGL